MSVTAHPVRASEEESGSPSGAAASFVLALTPGLIGAAVLVGWYAPLPALTTWGFTAAATKPLTATCFVALSLALVLPRLGWPNVAALFGYAVVATAAASLLQDAGLIRLGIDVWLAPAGSVTGVGGPRWSPATVTSVALLPAGVAVLLRRLAASSSTADFLAAGTGVIGMIALLGHLFSVEQLYRLQPLSAVALPSATGLFAFALAALSVAEAGQARRSFSLRELIVATVIFTAVPLLILSLNVLGRMVEAERQAARVGLMQSARTLAVAVDNHISDYLALAHALTFSRNLADGDLRGFREQAVGALEFVSGSHVYLSDEAGQFLVSTAVPFGQPLPRRANMELHQRALANNRAQVSGLFTGSVANEPVATVEWPVRRPGLPTYVLTITMQPERLQELMRRQQYPSGWIVAVIDHQHRFVARVPLPEAGLGSLSAEGWRTAIVRRPEGFVENISVDGYPILTAYLPTAHGWTVGVGVQKEVLDAPARATFWRTAAFGAALTALSILLGWLASRRIARPAAMLNAAAASLTENRPIAVARTGVTEFDSVTRALADAAEKLRSCDVALRRLTEQLAQSEERLRLATESADMGWFDYDAATGEGVWARSNFRMFGLPPQPEGRTTLAMWRARLHPQDVARVLAARDEAERERTPYNVEYRIIRADDGRVAWLQANGRCLYDANGNAWRFVGVLLDISDRKRAEEALRTNEERLRLATQAWGLGWWDIDLATGAAQWSRSHFHILGYEPRPDGSATMDMWRSRVHPDDLARIDEDFLHARNTRSAFRNEHRIIRADNGDIVWLFVNGRVIYDYDGAPQRFVGILIDITERKRAEGALRASEERLRLASEAAGFGSYDFDPVADRSVWSPQLARLLGRPADEVSADTARVLDAVHPEDKERVAAEMTALAEGRADELYELEFRIVRPDGEVRWVLDRGRVWVSAVGGPVVRITGTVLDITDRRQSEEAIRRAQQRLELAQAAGHVGVWSYESDTDVVQPPVHFLRALVFPESEQRPNLEEFRARVHPDDLVALDTARSAERSADHGAAFTVQLRYRRPDGSYAWVERRSRVDIDAEGRRRIVGAIVDISERRSIEEALRESEARFATAFQLAPVAVAVTTRAEGRYVDVNEGTLALSGFTRDEIIGKTVREIGSYADPQDFARVRRLLAEHGRIDNLEVRLRRKDGGIRTVLMSAAPIALGGEDHVLVAAVDITARKTDEADVARLAAIVTSSTDAIVSKTLGGVVTSWNAAAERLFGYGAEEMIGQPLLRIFPPDRQAEEEYLLGRVRAGEEIEHFETVRVAKEGREIDVSVSLSPIRDHKGGVIGVSTIVRDITEQKRVEAALRDAQAGALRAFTELEAIYASAPVGLCVLSPQGRYLRINQRLAEINGVPANEHIGRSFQEIIPDVAEAAQTLLDRVAATGEPILDVEIEGETTAQPGVRRVWLEQWSPVKDEAGRVVAVNVVAEEITARKEAEEALARSNALLRALTDTTPGLIYVKDREGRMVLANPATLAALGKNWDEVRGKTDADYLVDPAQAAHIMEVDRRVMESGEIQSAEEEVTSPEGIRTFVSIKSPLRDGHGTVVGLVGVSTDITERKKSEEHLNFVLRELSHRTKNLFAVVLAIANQTARQVNNFSEFSTRFAARVHALARAHDLLVHSDWTGAPIAEVVRAQTEPFGERIEIAGPNVSLRPEAVQNLSLALHELATNATKYGALSNGEGRVRVSWAPFESGGARQGYLFEWREAGGPQVAAPDRRGFGSTVLSRIAESSFGAPATLDFEPAGVRWTLRIPPQHVVAERTPERTN